MSNDDIMKILEEIKQNQVELLEIISEISDDVLDVQDSFDEMKNQTESLMDDGALSGLMKGITEAFSQVTDVEAEEVQPQEKIKYGDWWIYCTHNFIFLFE